jgi:hypothetical protein
MIVLIIRQPLLYNKEAQRGKNDPGKRKLQPFSLEGKNSKSLQKSIPLRKKPTKGAITP